MKTFVKLGLVGLALAASTAYADITPPGSGNGELTLFVRNETTGVVYVRGLQVTLDGVVTQSVINGPYAGDTVAGRTQQLNAGLATVNADQTLHDFLNGTDSFTWTIMAGDNVGATTAGSTDSRRYLTTTQVLWGDPSETAGAVVGTVTNGNTISFNNLAAMTTQINNAIAGSVQGDGSSAASGGQWRQAGANPGSTMGNWSGSGPNTVNALGTAAHLYVMASIVGTTGTRAQIYQGYDVILGLDGTLSAIAPPAVPLPPAIWMLVSGVLTLAGVGRRNSKAVAPVAA